MSFQTLPSSSCATRRSRSLRWLFLAAIFVLGLGISGCSQSQIYASSKSQGVFFTVPSSWHEIPASHLVKEEAKQDGANAQAIAEMMRYQSAFSPSKELGAKEVLDDAAPKSPIAFARVLNLDPSISDQISNNWLRELVFPITTWQGDTSTTAIPFSLINDEEVIYKGARGIRSIYTFTPKGGEAQTIDQISVASPDKSTIYLLIVRCTATCFSKNVKTLTKIADSFTVVGSK